MWEVIAAGLAKAPQDRPASAAEFANRLRAAGASLGWDIPAPVFGRGQRPVGDHTVTSGPPALAGSSPGAVDQKAPPGDRTTAPPPGKAGVSPRMRLARLGVAAVFLVAAAAVALSGGRLPGLGAPGQEPTPRASATSEGQATTPPRGGSQGSDPEAVLAAAPRGYRVQPATAQLQAQAERGTKTLDPDGRLVTATQARQVLDGQTPVALAIAYGLSDEAANPLVVEDRIVGSALDAGASRAPGSPPTWRGTVTGTNGEVSTAAVLLADGTALTLLGSDKSAVDALVAAWRRELR